MSESYDEMLALLSEVLRSGQEPCALLVTGFNSQEQFDAYVDPSHPDYKPKDVVMVNGRPQLVEIDAR